MRRGGYSVSSRRSGRLGSTFMTSGIRPTIWRLETGAPLRDLMARIGHGSMRAAVIYRHKTSGATAGSRTPLSH
jgi:hypothetical protein